MGVEHERSEGWYSYASVDLVRRSFGRRLARRVYTMNDASDSVR